MQHLSIQFKDGSIKSFNIEHITQYSIINIDTSRKEHSAKEARYNQFKDIYYTLSQDEICNQLNITYRTYLRYKNQLLN